MGVAGDQGVDGDLHGRLVEAEACQTERRGDVDVLGEFLDRLARRAGKQQGPAIGFLIEAGGGLGVTRRNVRYQAKRGRIKATMLGDRYVVTATEVQRYQKEQAGKPGRKPKNGGEQ